MVDQQIPEKVWVLAQNMKETEWGGTNFDILLLTLPDGRVTPLFTSLEKAQLFATALARYQVDFSGFRVYEVTEPIVKGKTWLDPSPVEVINKLVESSEHKGEEE